MRTLLIVLSAIFCTITAAFATPQIKDKIIYNGVEYYLQSNPLEGYFEKYPDKRPPNYTQINDTTFVFNMLSALWRGYVATLEIKDNELYIKDIEARIYVDGEYVWGSVLTEVFPMREELKMDWFTGSLEMPYGKVVDYGYYFSKYENYIVLDIENGVLKQEHRYTLAEYESSRYII